MAKEQPKGKSILERLQAAAGQKYLGVSMQELSREFVRLHENGDAETMQKIVEAVFNWEQLGIKDRSVSGKMIKDRVLENLDFIAKTADKIAMAGGDDLSGLMMTVDNQYAGAGKIQRFFREAVGYNPKTPPTPGLN